MASSEEALKRFVCEVAGTSYENRQRVIRSLSKGDPVILWNTPIKGKDEEAIAITVGGKASPVQIGWVPWSINKITRGMKLKNASIYRVGTDNDGAWTHIQIEVWYEPDKASEEVEEYGVLVAGALSRMKYRSLEHARRIAHLPTREIEIALEEWDVEGALINKERRNTKKGKS